MGSAPGRVELLSESEHTRVVRLRPPDGPSVIRKEPLGPHAEERVGREIGILRRLSGVAHIVQLAPRQADARSITMVDVPGSPLARVATPLEPSRMVELMLELARVVATVHQHGVVHGDINPGNILVGDDGYPQLIDFALATTFAELRPEFTHPREIVGTLPYLAPEQTGRTGRSADRRADLYGLGATMYELATGRPPFGTGDPLRLIHDHLARPAAPPAVVNPALPSGLSEVILHLLEKEPDSRYQTAEGLIRDLERVRDGAQRLRVGEDDVPLRLTEPSRLVGRDHEIDVLRSAFEGALAGECRGVAISGESGVGKSALLDELRPMVTDVDGWFSSGKFDRDRQDLEHDGAVQALRGLGRLLLAEPEDELVEIRQRLSQALGPNTGVAAAVLPEFATLLGVAPDPGDPLTAQVRARLTALEILRAVASRKRPVVFVVDDVQWAGATPLGLLDELLSGDEEIEALLVVVAYRESEVPESHPLAPMAVRWRRHPGRPEYLRIANLDEADLATMVAEMLHAPVESTTDLATPVFDITRGNPYETVALLNGLRREGVLRPTGSGWRWDQAAVEQRLAREDVTELTQARVDGMPPQTRHTLAAMACLGGEVQLSTIGVATGLPMTAVQQRLAPALDEGLLVMVARGQRARFYHDRMRDMVLGRIPARPLQQLRLRLARRLADRPELFAAAADQYRPVVDALSNPQERHRAAELLRRTADQRMWTGESLPAEQMLAAALRLTEDPATLVQLHTLRHAALFRLGRLAEADEAYQAILSLGTEPYGHVEATRVQVSSLTNRSRLDEAIALGLGLLRRLGWAVPTSEQVNIEIEREIDWLTRWIDETSEGDDLRRPSVSDPAILSAGGLISQMIPAAAVRDQVTMAWLTVAAARTWAEKGPTKTLVGAVGHMSLVLIARRQAYRSAHRLLRRLLAVGEQRGFEPSTSQVRNIYVYNQCHWSEPIEEQPAQAKQAREGLIRGGDLQYAAYSFLPTLFEIDLAATVDDYAAEVDAALTFAERTGNQLVAGLIRTNQRLVAALRGERGAADWSAEAEQLAGVPPAAGYDHVAQALAAAVLDDPDALARHSAAAVSLRWAIEATYAVWQMHVVRAIALAHRLRTAPEHSAELAELDGIVDWVAQRARDMPTNFRHMLSLVEAERAWAVGDFRTASRAFDSALRSAGHRPWHRAYIAERYARLMLAQGMDHAGWVMIVEAREAYRVWGARAKVDQLDRAYPSLDISTDPLAGRMPRRSTITAGAIDMLGILDASQALSSETSIGALRARVVEVLTGMTGATDVILLLWNGERHRWLTTADDGDSLTPLDERRPAPHSVIRYVERTREPLIVADATHDDRFARDPYFAGMKACSLLTTPVISRGELRAILHLENRLISDAFPAQRLEAVVLIARQLATSLDNAFIYSSLERKVAERTRQLALANERLAQLSITDPLTGLANRRRLEDALRDEWQRVRRTRTPLSVAMVDIDHFKQYNDLHGHLGGDRCLQRVAAQIDRNVRDTDLVARYGGEEFAIVMPDTNPADAGSAAERVRIAIADLAEPLTADQVVTASVGVATLHSPEQGNTEQLLKQADAALYHAKRTGRNRVASADLG